jgi:two-component system, chemotaxis family, protein-glutamate methylesterase/glutaminase
MEPSHSRPLAGLASKNPDVVSKGQLPEQDCRTRVLVVDDSSSMQRWLTEILHSAPDLRVVGYAGSGAEAIRLAEELTPDVITMDINVSGMDGLRAIDCIMWSNPRPIVIVSSYNQKGSRAAFQGLDIGVVDIIEKPALNGPASEMLHSTTEIIGKIRMAAGIRLLPKFNYSPGKTCSSAAVGRVSTKHERPAEGSCLQYAAEGFPQVIAIGASTGGPAILQELLRVVHHESFPPIIIVQHMPERFNREFVEHLNAVSSLRVVEAREGQEPTRGTIYVSPGNAYVQINAQGCLAISDGPRVNYRKPSIDVLFHSLARRYGGQVLALVLTGMGEDGAVGASAIKHAGGIVIAQDEGSSMVFSMPGAAIKAGGVSHVLSKDRMKQLLLEVGEKTMPKSRPTSHDHLSYN